MKPIPMKEIEQILGEVMKIAAENGANSISMPDEYVAVAHFVAYPGQYIPNYQPIGYVVQHDGKGGNYFAGLGGFEGMLKTYGGKCQKVFVEMDDADGRLCRWCDNANTNHAGEDHVFASRKDSDPQASKLMLRTRT